MKSRVSVLSTFQTFPSDSAMGHDDPLWRLSSLRLDRGPPVVMVRVAQRLEITRFDALFSLLAGVGRVYWFPIMSYWILVYRFALIVRRTFGWLCNSVRA